MNYLGYLQEFFYVKLDKTPGPNFICIELIIHVRAALFFSFPNCVNSNFENLRKSACGRNSKYKEGGTRPKMLLTNLSTLRPLGKI